MTATPFPITGTTRVYGMIADPISHVRAPMVFNPVFEERGIDAVMVPLHLTLKIWRWPSGRWSKSLILVVFAYRSPQDGTAAICDELGPLRG